MLDITIIGVPEINRLAKTDSKEVVVAPINKVKVVIIEEIGGVKNFVGVLWDVSITLFELGTLEGFIKDGGELV